MNCGLGIRPAKDEANFAAHGLRLSDFAGFDMKPTVVEDERVDYGEPRFRAFGRIDGKGIAWSTPSATPGRG